VAWSYCTEWTGYRRKTAVDSMVRRSTGTPAQPYFLLVRAGQTFQENGKQMSCERNGSECEVMFLGTFARNLLYIPICCTIPNLPLLNMVCIPWVPTRRPFCRTLQNPQNRATHACLHPLEDIQIRQLFQLPHTLLVCFYHLLIVEQHPVIPNLDMRNVVPRMD
jgi:hypothetical protein